MQTRKNKILDLLLKQNKAEVSALSQLLGVSQVTIRKDLDSLEEQGIVKREHGYATLNNVDDLSSRMAWHYDLKQRLAQKAIEEVQDQETVMIESGSCCALVARALMEKRKDITLITNSGFIADFVRKNVSGTILLLGGEYQPQSQCNVGPITRSCAENFFVDKLFIGADGFSISSGFTGKDYMRAQTVKDMARQARQVIVVTQSSKFEQMGTVNLIGLNQVKQVITDEDIPQTVREYLEENGIEVKTVPADPAAEI